MKTRTLVERLAKRNHRELVSLPPHDHVRAELQRVARQIRKKKVKSATKYSEEWYYNAGIDDAIELLREAQR